MARLQRLSSSNQPTLFDMAGKKIMQVTGQRGRLEYRSLYATVNKQH